MITSMDKLLAQQIADTVKDVCGHNINFINRAGIIFAGTDEKRIGNFHEIGYKAAQTETVIEVSEEEGYEGTQKGVNLPVYNNGIFVAVIGISGDPGEVRKYAHLAEKITHLLIRERELSAFSRTVSEKKHYVIQTLLSGENLEVDYLSECLRELGIDREGEKRVLIIRMNSDRGFPHSASIERKIQEMLEMAGISLFTYYYPNKYLAIADARDFQKKLGIFQKFAKDHEKDVKIAAGKVCSVFQLADSYQSGLTALKSLSEKSGGLAVFDDLILEIVISSLDAGSKEAYLNKTVAKLNEDDMSLMAVYFDEEMSLKNTCQRLYLHKNTVQNRLDKIYDKCGLNPRKFRDAVVLYLAVKLKNDGEAQADL